MWSLPHSSGYAIDHQPNHLNKNHLTHNIASNEPETGARGVSSGEPSDKDRWAGQSFAGRRRRGTRWSHSTPRWSVHCTRAPVSVPSGSWLGTKQEACPGWRLPLPHWNQLNDHWKIMGSLEKLGCHPISAFNFFSQFFKELTNKILSNREEYSENF